MPTVEGLIPVAVVGLLGALISEALRVAAYIQQQGGFPPGPLVVVSLIYVLLGLGVLFYGVSPAKNAIEVAQLGAAFPLLWSAAVRAAGGGGGGGGGGQDTRRRVGPLEYTGWRF